MKTKIMKKKSIGAHSKLGLNYLYYYWISSYKSIFDYYKKPSDRKVGIYADLISECAATGGHDIRILFGNTYRFTAAWRKGTTLIVTTPHHRYYVERKI